MFIGVHSSIAPFPRLGCGNALTLLKAPNNDEISVQWRLLIDVKWQRIFVYLTRNYHLLQKGIEV
jgi:hypothetical protein